MIGGEQPTPLDVRFPLGPIPVRVSVLFWLIMALLGWGVVGDVPNRWVNLLVWVGCGFVSILVHELGHAVAYLLFGSRSAITLHGFGGYAQADVEPRSAGARMLVALAGPVAGYAVCGLAFAGLWAVGTNPAGLHPYALNALTYLFVMNLFWNTFNLLPILPLDGGRVFREVCAVFRMSNPDVAAHGLSFALAGALAVWGGLCVSRALPDDVRRAVPNWAEPGIFMTLWFAVLAIDNFQRMQMHARRRAYYDQPDDDTPPWRR